MRDRRGKYRRKPPSNQEHVVALLRRRPAVGGRGGSGARSGSGWHGPQLALRPCFRHPSCLRLNLFKYDARGRLRPALTMSEPLPIDAVLPDLTAALRAALRRGPGRAAGGGQDDAGAAGPARRAVGGGRRSSCSSRAGSRRGRRRPDGGDARRGRRRDRRLPRADAAEVSPRPASRSSPRASSPA